MRGDKRVAPPYESPQHEGNFQQQHGRGGKAPGPAQRRSSGAGSRVATGYPGADADTADSRGEYRGEERHTGVEVQATGVVLAAPPHRGHSVSRGYPSGALDGTPGQESSGAVWGESWAESPPLQDGMEVESVGPAPSVTSAGLRPSQGRDGGAVPGPFNASAGDLHRSGAERMGRTSKWAEGASQALPVRETLIPVWLLGGWWSR